MTLLSQKTTVTPHPGPPLGGGRQIIQGRGQRRGVRGGYEHTVPSGAVLKQLGMSGRSWVNFGKVGKTGRRQHKKHLKRVARLVVK